MFFSYFIRYDKHDYKYVYSNTTEYFGKFCIKFRGNLGNHLKHKKIKSHNTRII